MRIRRIAVSAAFAAGLAALPPATAKAQYYPPQYYPPCSPFPLFWPFCVAGAIVGTAATIVAAPFVALTAPPYYYGYYGRPYYAPRYYGPPYYYGPRLSPPCVSRLCDACMVFLIRTPAASLRAKQSKLGRLGPSPVGLLRCRAPA